MTDRERTNGGTFLGEAGEGSLGVFILNPYLKHMAGARGKRVVIVNSLKVVIGNYYKLGGTA
ncbi:hypothetical protein BH747_04295 [Enterococcus villorum]|uniref:Uncharacterized protein n=1 Tax=Enterococcus villorum TaxID=112904 RepID=A0A1V8YII7_9ENTE|nr:hypothetical protein BH747_04295 [Enterococcus villorum]OQO72437.1 hypothetical protein BH744_11570 [Enterococcus villorum]